MQPTSHDLKVVLMHSRLMTLQLQQAVAALRSGNVTAYESHLSEALVTSRSIVATIQAGSGNGFTTPDTTQERHTLFGTEQLALGVRGTSVQESLG